MSPWRPARSWPGSWPIRRACWPTPDTTSPTWPGSPCPAAVRFALRPRSPAHSFGYHRGTILAALANAAIIAAVTMAIVVVGVDRLLHPRPVEGGVVVGVALGAFGVNAFAAL